MQLSAIETIVLANTGYDKYSSLSADTDSAKMEDFALIHKCVNIARQEIVRNAHIPATFKHATAIATVASTRIYTIADTDFDVPVLVRYTTAGSDEYQLIQTNPNDVYNKVSAYGGTGTPAYYMVLDSTVAGLTRIELFPTPDTGGETVNMIYKPILTELTTSTDEDIVMKKYPETVIKIASAWAFQIIKKDAANYDKWLLLGRADFKLITAREVQFDPNQRLVTDDLLVSKRTGRYTV